MRFTRVRFLFLLGLLLAVGCSGIGSTVFINRQYNFDFVEKTAVLPFDNLSADQTAAARVTHIFLTELLASESFDVIEPGEVSKALEKYGGRTDALTQIQIQELGKTLGVQGIILGSVNESSSSRGGSSSSPVVTLDVRLIETETGQTVWSATHTQGGKGFWSSLFGTGEASQSEVTRKCVRKVIRTLVK